jgi:3-hexulose-6-phosphate synthase
MKFQISFDALDIDHNLKIAHQIAPLVDCIELGTVPLLKHGIKIVEIFREQFPNKLIFADTKIVDQGREIVGLFGSAGADWISVMGGTSKEVIQNVCTKAHDMGKKVMLDILDAGSPGQAALDAKSFGVDALMFHQPYDKNSQTLIFVEDWNMLKGNTNVPIFISSKIGRENIDQMIALNPDGIVIGKAITEHADPLTEAQFFYDKCKK